MANIELLIKVDEEVYKKAQETHDVLCDSVWLGIKKGIPLPKHGKLIDADAVFKECFPKADINAGALYNMRKYPYWGTNITGMISILKNAPAIVETETDTVTVGVKHDVLTKDDIKDIDLKDNVFVDATESLKQTIALVKEDQERFIFEAITPFLTDISEIVIPKRVLERALLTFREEHAAEWKVLMKEYGGTLV